MQEKGIFFSLVIPAYNEEMRIRTPLERDWAYLNSLGKPFEIIVVNDGSTDATAEIVTEMAESLGSIRLISYQPNRGKGHAVRRGVAESRGELVGFTDADLSSPIEEMAKLIKAIEGGADVAIGSRAIKGAVIPVHQPLYRELGGKGLNLVIQMLAVRGIRDTQCGLKLFRGDIAREIFSKAFLDGWGFDVELLYLARKSGYSISEVPVTWSHSEGSKIHPLDAAVRIIFDLIKMRAHRY